MNIIEMLSRINISLFGIKQAMDSAEKQLCYHIDNDDDDGIVQNLAELLYCYELWDFVGEEIESRW